MRLPIYQIDAFTDRVFAGNPAAVVPLEAWLPDATMQAIAAENNLAETAFFVADGDEYALRWFTPTVEVDLCGHATLATAFVIFERLAPTRDRVAFQTLKAGTLTVARAADRLMLDFPLWRPAPVATPAALSEALGRAPPPRCSRASAMSPSLATRRKSRRWLLISARSPASAAMAWWRPVRDMAIATSFRAISRRQRASTKTR
jgi:predicted PhzF superfamily epimerase YddE/YHI9